MDNSHDNNRNDGPMHEHHSHNDDHEQQRWFQQQQAYRNGQDTCASSFGRT